MYHLNNMTDSFSLTEEVTGLVRERILTGTYDIGEKIKEDKIAKELDVSRTPIREAFKNLENEGLIDYIPNRGCFARGLTSRDINDIHMIRKALEVLDVEWATEHITDRQIQELQDRWDVMEFYTMKKETQKALSTNSDFHEVIYEAAGSRFMAHILRSYKSYLAETKNADLYSLTYAEEVLEEHREILNAIRKRDAELAKAAMARHLEGSKRRAESVYNAAPY